MSTAPSISTTSKLVVPSTSKSPLKSTLPATVSVEAMSTAPSISTTSRFVVPSTSMSPEISRLAKTEVPVAVIMPVAVIAVPVIAAALEPPITAPSIVPPLMSAVSATRLSMFAVPSIYKSFHSEPDAPKS